MTHEEVIKQLLGIIEYNQDCDDPEEDDTVWRQDIVALNIAISTLAEVWGVKQEDLA